MIHQFAYVGDVNPANLGTTLKDYRSDTEQDGTRIAIFNPESHDVRLARKLAKEIINVSGAKVQVYVRTDNADYDRVFEEDPDPTYWNPIYLKAFTKPEPLETELTKWGPDTTNKTKIAFSYESVYEALGDRMLRVGDVVVVPFNAVGKLVPGNYRIENVTPSGNFRYTWLYLDCDITTLTADITVRPNEDMQDVPEEVMDTGGRYRESI